MRSLGGLDWLLTLLRTGGNARVDKLSIHAVLGQIFALVLHVAADALAEGRTPIGLL
jgi:hypothetical protein